MPVSKAQQKAVTKYVKNKYDRFGLTMPKGHLDEIKSHAEAQGQSVNAFINTAIDEKMSREVTKAPTSPAEVGKASLPSGDGEGTPAASEGQMEGINPASGDTLQEG